MLDLLIEHLPEGISPRQVEEVLDKNYHTTRSLLRKMEAAGEIRHVNSHYVAIPRNISRNHCNQRNQRNHCNQSIASALQPAGQIARCEEPCPPTIDYSDYASTSVLSHVSQTYSIPPPLAGVSLQPPPSAPEELLSQSGVMQDTRDQQDVDVINRHQGNQSMSSTTQAGDHVQQRSATCSDYADDSVTSNVSQTLGILLHWRQVLLGSPHRRREICSLREALQDAQDHQDITVISVINVINWNIHVHRRLAYDELTLAQR
jgi:hypothetical protein